MAKDKKMRKFGKAGYAGLVNKLGSAEAVTAHHAKLARKRWKMHPEQRAGAKKKKRAKV